MCIMVRTEHICLICSQGAASTGYRLDTRMLALQHSARRQGQEYKQQANFGAGTWAHVYTFCL